MGIFKRKDSPHWWYRVQLNGKVMTGSANTSDKRLAMRIYLEKNHQFTEEYHLPSHKGQSTNFFWMCGQFLEKHSKVNKRSWLDDEVILRKLKDHFGDVPLVNIQAEKIEGYKASRKGFVKEATINRELAVLKTLFTKAVLWGYAHKNPVKEVRLFKEERTPIRMLSAEEREKLFTASPDYLKPILLMALKTGMRHGEILNLKWSEVDLAHETISITHTKSKKLRQIPIHSELDAALRQLPRISTTVFCDDRGRPLNPQGKIRKDFDDLKAAAGLPELTFHMLRHNFASELISKGADIRTVQEYMGHSSLRMLQRYAHVNKGIWRSTIQLLGRDMQFSQGRAD
jgi:integrase